MISVLYPAFLVGGAVLASAAVALHLLRRRPPERRALPTARFLDEDPRTLLRLQRRPADPALLVIRVLFALLLCGAFAGLSWAPTRSGVARFVLVDVAGATVGGPQAMSAAIEAAVADAEADDLAVQVVGYGTTPEGAIMISADPQTLVSAVGGTRSPATTGLRALSASVLEAIDVDSVEVDWILRPDWAQWTTGVGLLRDAFWPGRIALRPTAPAGLAGETAGATGVGISTIDVTPPNSAGEGGRSAVVVGTRLARGSADATTIDEVTDDATPDASLQRALAALGVPIVTDLRADPAWIFADAPSAETLDALLLRARAGATLIVTGEVPVGEGDASELPWEAIAGPASEPRQVIRKSGEVVGAPVDLVGPRLRDGVSVIALFDDLRPAAGARPLGNGCVVFLRTTLTAPTLTGTPAYPDLVRDLLEGCGEPIDETAPLDQGALQALERPDLPVRIAVADLVEMRSTGAESPARGVRFTPLLLMLAIGAVSVETWMTRRGRA